MNIDMTPIVTLGRRHPPRPHGGQQLRGADVIIGGVNIPSFGQRTVTTRLRLRDGESNLLAGLYQENEQNGITGFPGAIHVPLLQQLFSHNTTQNDQVDVVMLLTPHIVRTHEITEADLKPINIGSQQNLGVGGPPPLIAGQPEAAPPVAAPGPGAGPAGFQTPTQPGTISTGAGTPPTTSFQTPTAPGTIATGPERSAPGGPVAAPPGTCGAGHRARAAGAKQRHGHLAAGAWW